MQQALAKLLLPVLAPMLMVQALWLKRIMPRLPEAKGPREGLIDKGDQEASIEGANLADLSMPTSVCTSPSDLAPSGVTTINLLILGDSAAAGVGVGSQQQALSGYLTARLSEHYRVRWTLLARSGLTTNNTLTHLSGESWQASLRQGQYDVVLLSLGVNDVLSPLSVTRWLSATERLLSQLRQHSPKAQLLLTPVPPLGAFLAFPQPLRWFVGQRSDEFNRRLQQVIDAQTGCQLLSLQLPLSADSLALDGFHPSESSYRLWAEVAAQQMLARRGINRD